MQKLARVRIVPRDPSALALSLDDAARTIKRGFGAVAADVSAVGVDGDAWRAVVVVDAGAAADAALLRDNADDERLWRSFVEASFAAGSCEVVALEEVPSSTTSRSASSRPAR